MGGGGVRVVAGMYVVICLAVAGFAVYALSLDPTTFQQLQMIKDSGRHQPEQGQAYCAATAAEAMAMRADAVLLLFWGASQALAAMVVVAAPSLAGTVCPQAAQVVSLMALKLADVLTGVVHVTIGRCHSHGSYRRALAFFYVIVALYSFMLFIYSVRKLGITLFSKVDG